MSELTVADRVAIQETLHRYSHCLDGGRWEEFAALFTDDCTLDLTQTLGLFEGAAGIRQFSDTMRSLDLFMRHLVTNIVIAGDGERVRVAAYVIAITGMRGSAPRQSTGVYDDELVKRGGRWLLQRRRLALDVPSA
jgi:3-phenylpropionate/cinnamic acid dioxygenase small subunit